MAIGDEVLKMAFANHQQGTLHANYNEPLELSKEPVKSEVESRVASIKTTDFVAVEATLAETYRIRS